MHPAGVGDVDQLPPAVEFHYRGEPVESFYESGFDQRVVEFQNLPRSG